MAPLPLNIQTLYADLCQQVQTADPDEATVVETVVANIRYVRLQRWVGATRTIQHLGRADDPAVQAIADRARREMPRRTERRKLVSVLRSFTPGPPAALGRVLDALSQAGLFKRGAILVGTAAYQCYPPLVGATLSASALMTQDADLATPDLTLSGTNEDEHLLTILRRADAGFVSIPGLDPRSPPARFRSPDGFVVDLLTPLRKRSDRNPMPLSRLGAGAVPLQHLAWLLKEPVRAVALHGSGVPVIVPRPERYAVHKLVVAQKRPGGDRAKRLKDLEQARALMTAIEASAPFDLEDALEDGRRQGRRGWDIPIARSLQELSRSP